MLELYGKGYVIEHCIALLRRQSKEKLYKVYITDGIKAIADTLAHMSQNGGTSLNVRWYELDTPQKKDTRTADEIISSIKQKLTGGDDEDDAI